MPEQMPVIQLLIVDDHPAVRDGLALLLAPEGIALCGAASTPAEALAALADTAPDVALVDLSLGADDGLPLVATLFTRRVRVLVYSMHEDARHVEGAFAAGALGYVTKRELHGVLVEAIRAVAAGRRFVSPYAAIALAERLTMPPPPDIARALSDQEEQIFHLLGQGDGAQQIAAIMDISVRTVESYCARIQAKLGLSGMRALRRHAIMHRRAHQ